MKDRNNGVKDRRWKRWWWRRGDGGGGEGGGGGGGGDGGSVGAGLAHTEYGTAVPVPWGVYTSDSRNSETDFSRDTFVVIKHKKVYWDIMRRAPGIRDVPRSTRITGTCSTRVGTLLAHARAL